MKKDEIHPVNSYVFACRFAGIVFSILSSFWWFAIPHLIYPLDGTGVLGLCYIIALNLICYSWCLYYFLAQTNKYRYMETINGEFVVYRSRKGNKLESYRFKTDSRFVVLGYGKWSYKVQIVDVLGIKHIENVDKDFFARYEIPDHLIEWK